MPSVDSILSELNHLVFDEHKVISSKWLSNHFSIHIEHSKHILADFASKHKTELLTHHCITGYRPLSIRHDKAYDTKHESTADADTVMSECSETVNAFTILLAADSALESTKDSFDRILSVDVHSVSRSESKSIADYHNALYLCDYEQQKNVMTSFLSPQSAKGEPIDATTFSAIFNSNSNSNGNGKEGVHTLSARPLHSAIAPSAPSTTSKKVEIQSQHNSKGPTLDEKVERIEQIQNGQTPLKKKFEGLALDKKEEEKKKRAPKAGGIAACFAKQNEKKKEVESKKKKKAESKETTKKKKRKKSQKEKRSKNKKSAVKAARKRKRGSGSGSVDGEDNLVAIMYDAESSESEGDDARFDMERDEELEAIKSRSTQNKRRKIDDIDSEDEDSDLETEEMRKKEADRERKEKEKEEEMERERERTKEMAKRKRNLFGYRSAATSKKKRYKTVARSYVNAKGMMVSEDVKVTDDEEGDDGDQRKSHRHQEQEEEDMDIDIDIESRSRSMEKEKENRRMKHKNKAVRGQKKAKHKNAKNGSITSFFKAK